MIAIDALDALGVALAAHGHQWSNRERHLYERAIKELISSSSRKDSGLLVSEKFPRPTPSRKSLQECVPA